MDIGAQLRDSREARGISLAQIAERTRVQPRILTAIEQNDLAVIPPKPFGRGFVRSYAREVGLDPEQTVRDYFGRFAPPAPVPDPAAQEAERRSPSPWVLAGVAAAVCLLAAQLLLRSNTVEADNPLENPPVGTSGAPADVHAVSNGSPVQAAEANRPEAATPLEMTLRAERPSWITAFADGRRVAYRLLPAGSTVTLRASRAIRVRAGDAGALRLTINGKDAGALGRDGEVRTRRFDAGSVPQF